MSVIAKKRCHRNFVRDSLKLQKCCQQFIRANDKPFPVVATCVNDPDCSPVAINRRDPAQTPTGFAKSVGDSFARQ